MKESILKDYGWCRIVRKDADFYICFDEGQVVISMNTYQISEQEANKAKASEVEAEKVARSVQMRK